MMGNRSILDEEIGLAKTVLARRMRNRNAQFYLNRLQRPLNSRKISQTENGTYGPDILRRQSQISTVSLERARRSIRLEASRAGAGPRALAFAVREVGRFANNPTPIRRSRPPTSLLPTNLECGTTTKPQMPVSQDSR
jgi:hypothetical protein